MCRLRRLALGAFGVRRASGATAAEDEIGEPVCFPLRRIARCADGDPALQQPGDGLIAGILLQGEQGVARDSRRALHRSWGERRAWRLPRQKIPLSADHGTGGSRRSTSSSRA
jgi:hypothetical protein